MASARMTTYRDRAHAGDVLAGALNNALDESTLILALPRGGVAVGVELARQFQAELDVLVVRKLGAPDQEELAIGAVGPGGIWVLNDAVARSVGLDRDRLEALIEGKQHEVHDREQWYRGERPTPKIEGRTICIVDDGVATGSSMAAAVQVIRQQNPGRLIAAIPVAPPDVCRNLERQVDQLVCPAQPDSFRCVGAWYSDFDEVTDEQVTAMLNENRPSG